MKSLIIFLLIFGCAGILSGCSIGSYQGKSAKELWDENKQLTKDIEDVKKQNAMLIEEKSDAHQQKIDDCITLAERRFDTTLELNSTPSESDPTVRHWKSDDISKQTKATLQADRDFCLKRYQE